MSKQHNNPTPDNNITTPIKLIEHDYIFVQYDTTTCLYCSSNTNVVHSFFVFIVTLVAFSSKLTDYHRLNDGLINSLEGLGQFFNFFSGGG